MRKRLLDTAKIIFFLGLGLFFIWLFLHNLTPDEKKDIYASLLSADYFWIIISVILALMSHISRSVRWNLLLEPMGFKPRLRNTFMAVMIGYFANMALPRLGEVTRCGILARYEKIPLQKSFGTVVTERGIDLITLMSAFVLNFIINIDKFTVFRKTSIVRKISEGYHKLEHPGRIYWIAIGTFLIIVVLMFRLRPMISHTKIYKKIKEVILGFAEGIRSLTRIKRPWWFVFHSLVIWLLYLMMTWIVFFSIPETSGLNLGVGLAVLVFGSVGIIVVQGGIGIYPWIVAEILALYAVPQTKGYALGWLLWSGQSLTIVVIGILSLTLLPVLNRKGNELS